MDDILHTIHGSQHKRNKHHQEQLQSLYAEKDKAQQRVNYLATLKPVHQAYRWNPSIEGLHWIPPLSPFINLIDGAPSLRPSIWRLHWVSPLFNSEVIRKYYIFESDVSSYLRDNSSTGINQSIGIGIRLYTPTASQPADPDVSSIRSCVYMDLLLSGAYNSISLVYSCIYTIKYLHC